MKKVSQVIPKEQKDILVKGLKIMEVTLKALKSEDENLNYMLFDIATLKAMLNGTELVVNIPFESYESFSEINGIDFPSYIV
jgi:hypothetical protein